MKKIKISGLVLFVAVVLAIGGIVSIWAPDRSAEDLSARWAPPPSQFVLVDGMKVHLRDEGLRDDPMPLILLHGTSSSLHTWDGWTLVLKEKHRVIRVDLPGFGLTGPNADGDYRMQVYCIYNVPRWRAIRWVAMSLGRLRWTFRIGLASWF